MSKYVFKEETMHTTNSVPTTAPTNVVAAVDNKDAIEARLYGKIRSMLDYNDKKITDKLAETDTEKKKFLHKNYAFKALESCGVSLSDQEKIDLVSSLDVVNDEIYYYELLSKIFPQKMIGGGESIHNLNDLVIYFRNEINNERKPIKVLFNEIKGSNIELEYDQFKKSLSRRGVILRDALYGELFEQLDTSKNYKVSYDEFKSKIQMMDIDVNVNLNKFKDILNIIQKTPADLFTQYSNGDSKLSLDEFSTMLASSGVVASMLEVEQLFDHIDADKTGEISSENFTNALGTVEIFKPEGFNPSTFRRNIRLLIIEKFTGFEALFNYYDYSSRGTMNILTFKEFVAACGFKDVPDVDIRSVYNMINGNQDPTITKAEFTAFYDESSINALFPTIYRFNQALTNMVIQDHISVRYLFHKYDEDKDSYLNETEFKNLVIGIKVEDISDEDLQFLFKSLASEDTTRANQISEAGLRWFLNSNQIIDVIELVERIKNYFRRIRLDYINSFNNADPDKSGSIDSYEFYNFFALTLKLNLTIIETEELFHFIDVGEKGRITRAHYEQIFDSYNPINFQEYNKAYFNSLPKVAYNYYNEKYFHKLPLVTGPNDLLYSQNDDLLFESVQMMPNQSNNNTRGFSQNFNRPVRGDLKDPTSQKFAEKVFTLMKTQHMTLEVFFSHFDKDTNHVFSFDEFKNMWNFIKMKDADESEKQGIYTLMEPNSNNEIPYHNFKRFLTNMKLLKDNSATGARQMIPKVERAATDLMNQRRMDPVTFFVSYSEKKEDSLNQREFSMMMRDLKLTQDGYTLQDFDNLFELLDKNLIGKVTYPQFRAIFRDTAEISKSVVNNIEDDLLSDARDRIIQYGEQRAFNEMAISDIEGYGVIRGEAFLDFLSTHLQIKNEGKALMLFNIVSIDRKNVNYENFLRKLGFNNFKGLDQFKREAAGNKSSDEQLMNRFRKSFETH